jgi:hypothetical protein
MALSILDRIPGSLSKDIQAKSRTGVVVRPGTADHVVVCGFPVVAMRRKITLKMNIALKSCTTAFNP